MTDTAGALAPDTGLYLMNDYSVVKVLLKVIHLARSRFRFSSVRNHSLHLFGLGPYSYTPCFEKIFNFYSIASFNDLRAALMLLFTAFTFTPSAAATSARVIS